MEKDYYKILEVSPDADSLTIKKAYREKALLLHPDVQSEQSSEQFLAVKEAYEVLSDPDKRANYDSGGLADFFFEEEAPEPKRKSSPPPFVYQEYHKAKERGTIDYTKYFELSRKIGFVSLSIALIFLLDFSIYRNKPDEKVLFAQSKASITGLEEDQMTDFVRTMGGHQFEWARAEGESEILPGETIQLQASLVFGFARVKRTLPGSSYNPVNNVVYFIVGVALFVTICAFFAIHHKRSAERKFNAALISAFFCIVLFVALFLQ